MQFVDSFNLLGVEAMQLPCIKGEGAPTSATTGAVGLLYMNTKTGDLYKFISVTGSVYTWAALVPANIVTSVNDVAPDENGNVVVKTGSSVPHVVIEVDPEALTATCNYKGTEVVSFVTQKQPFTCVVTNNREYYHGNPCLVFRSGELSYKLEEYVITTGFGSETWRVMKL